MFINSINPIFIEAGPIVIRWYGLFLAIGVLCSVLIITKLFKQTKLRPQDAVDLCIWLIIGGLIGARIGEVLFYEPAFYFSHPLEIIFINHGGLSSHGMTLGLLIAFYIFVRYHLTPAPSPSKGEGNWKRIADLLIIPIPLLAAFIRIGNFFNSEIVGKATNLPWGVKFPLYEASPIFRHPSQLYESLISLSLFISLYFIYKKYGPKLPQLFLTHLFLLLYFFSRFLIEFLKADYQTSLGLTMGQILGVPFILWSVGWFIQNFEYKKRT